MQRSLLFLLGSLCVCSLYAQQTPNKAYAITSSRQGSYSWTQVKEIDLQTGQVLQDVSGSWQTPGDVKNARSFKTIALQTATVAGTDSMPFASLAAACAYDQRHNRLYYMPMFINQLRYIDLDEKKKGIYYFNEEKFTAATNLNEEANHITRMVMGSDGDGYAMSNDAHHLIRFTTGKKPVITDLGSVLDDPENGAVSIHTKSTSWGGDLVADAFGNLYLVSAFHAVFRINLQNRVATYLGKISGLPADFTTNGAVVDEEGNLVVSSASSTIGYYRVNMYSWEATPLTAGSTVFNTSDLANGNLAFEKEAREQEAVKVFDRQLVSNKAVSVCPNPVVYKTFRVSFNGVPAGRYSVQLMDISGRVVQENAVQVSYTGQSASFTTQQGTSGVYLVKVLNNGQKTVFASKLLVR